LKREVTLRYQDLNIQYVFLSLKYVSGRQELCEA